MAARTRVFRRIVCLNFAFGRLSLRETPKGNLLKCQMYAAMIALGDDIYRCSNVNHIFKSYQHCWERQSLTEASF